MDFKFDYKNTKVQQLANLIQGSISAKELKAGDKIPSINFMSEKYNVSRDTVFKAFRLLKEKGIIKAIHGKNYYVAEEQPTIFLLLDEYSPFKESLYNSLIKELPSNYIVDLWFHQYNESLFNSIINEAAGKYSKYIVMNYDNEKFSDVLSKIGANQLMLIDFGKFDKKEFSYVCQDFDNGLYNALSTINNELKQKYKKLIFILDGQNKHPQSSKDYFIEFCTDNCYEYEIRDNVQAINASCCYIVIRPMDVVEIVKRSKEQGFEIGKEFGLIAYNENPFYEIIGNGIPCISIDFNHLGSLAGKFAYLGKKTQRFLPTQVFRKYSI